MKKLVLVLVFIFISINFSIAREHPPPQSGSGELHSMMLAITRINEKLDDALVNIATLQTQILDFTDTKRRLTELETQQQNMLGGLRTLKWLIGLLTPSVFVVGIVAGKKIKLVH